MSGDESESSGRPVGLGLIAFPPAVFMMSIAIDTAMPLAGTGRAWLFNAVSLAEGFGALLALICAPISLAACDDSGDADRRERSS